MSRRHIATRYDDKNAKALCKICHIWWHANPVDAIEWVKLIIGSENYNALRIKANTICKITRDNKELIRRDLIERIKLMETSEEECWLDINGHITKRC